MKRRESESNKLNTQKTPGLTATERSLLLFRVAGQMGIGDASSLPYMAGFKTTK